MEYEVSKKSHFRTREKILKGLARAFIVVLVSLFATEAILQIFDPLDLKFYDDARNYFSSRVMNTGYGFYINRPGDKYTMRRGVAIHINREGFRGKDFSVDKPDNTIRVLCVGDSMVFGWDAPENSIFSVVLQKMARNDGFPCEVINASACSWNTVMEYDFLDHRGKLYDPDVLLLLVVGNDLLTPKNSPRRRSSQFEHILKGNTGIRHSYLVRACLHFENKFLAGSDFLREHERNPKISDENIAAMREIISLCKTQNIRPLIFLGVTGDGSSPFDQMYCRLYSDELKQQGVVAHKCEVHFSGRFRISLSDPHPSAIGHERIAQSMYPYLRSILTELSSQ